MISAILVHLNWQFFIRPSSKPTPNSSADRLFGFRHKDRSIISFTSVSQWKHPWRRIFHRSYLPVGPISVTWAHRIVQWIDTIFRYPCLKTARLLLQCAVDVNSTDAIRNTPLHIFASNAGVPDDCAILDLLYNHGAHLDQANSQGQTALDLTKNPAIIEWFKRRARYSLKCLCARTIQRNNMAFRESLTHSLVIFVEKHWRQRHWIKTRKDRQNDLWKADPLSSLKYNS